MSNAEVAALAAKNEYVEARLAMAVEILLLARSWTSLIGSLLDNPDVPEEIVREHLEKLLYGADPDACLIPQRYRHFYQRALDIVNLPRVVASASAPIQGTKREVGQ